MPITPSFTTSESISSPNLITFLDNSTGSDGTLTERRIFVVGADGNPIVPEGTTTDYIVWAYASSSIQVDLITKSTAANVTVIWYAGATPTYTKTILTEWNFYDYLFAFQLLQTQTSQPNIVDDTNYYSNLTKLVVNLFQAANAVTNMDDLYSAQAALDRNQYLINNQNLFY